MIRSPDTEEVTITSESSPASGWSRVGVTALTAVAPAAWGTTYVVTTELLPADHPLFAGLARALPAGLLALLLSRSLPHGSWWWRSAMLGTLNIGAFFPLLFVAADRLPGGAAATLGAAQPVVVALLAVLVLGERLSRWRLSWGMVGVAGVGMVVLGPAAALDPAGVIAGLSGTTSMAVGVVLTKRWGRPESVGPLGFAAWQLTAGGLVLLIPALLIEGVPPQIDGYAVVGYLWLGLIGGLVAYSLWFAGIRRLPVTATALLGLLSPLVAATLGFLITRETFSAIQVAGLLLALCAMFAGQMTPRSPRTSRSPSAATSDNDPTPIRPVTTQPQMSHL